MLGNMRDGSGGPSLPVRALAVLLVLLLAGPLTLLLARGVRTLLHLAL